MSNLKISEDIVVLIHQIGKQFKSKQVLATLSRLLKKMIAYAELGINLEGHKELPGLWLAETEGTKFWLSALIGLHFSIQKSVTERSSDTSSWGIST